MKQLRKILFPTIVFATCLFISQDFIKADLTCKSTLKKGSSGIEVKELQTALNKIMNCNLTTDGKFGSVGIDTCSKLNVDYASDHDYIVVNAKLNIRKTPSTEYDKIGTIERGTVYKVYETVQKSGQYPWHKIKYNDGYGYIYGEFVDKNAIVVDISDQILHMYKQSKLVLQAPVITGKVSEGFDTPTGRFLMKTTGKIEGKYLTSKKYGYKSWVDFWMPFNGGIGFHDAGWQPTFGGDRYVNNGSHGCINMPPAKAKEFYGMLSDGCPVVIHY